MENNKNPIAVRQKKKEEWLKSELKRISAKYPDTNEVYVDKHIIILDLKKFLRVMSKSITKTQNLKILSTLVDKLKML